MRALLFTLCLLAPASLLAHAGAGWTPGGSWLLVGPPVGYTFRGDDSGLCGGLEISLAQFVEEDMIWFGAYADAIYDGGADALRLSVGPELGTLFLGLDGGLLAERRGGEFELGYTARIIASLAVVGVYYRYGRLLTGEEEGLSELGLLFKFPIEL